MLLEALGDAREGRAASREQVERVHDAAYVELLAALERRRWLDGDTVAGPTSCDAALLAAGCALEAVERGGVRARAPARASRAAGPRDGVLPVRQRRGRGAPRAGRARDRARRDRRLGRAPRQRDAGDLPRRRLGALRLAAPVAVLSRHAAGPARATATTLNVPLAAGVGRRGVPRPRSTSSSAARARRSTPSSSSSRPASTRTIDDPLAQMRGNRATASRSSRGGRPRSAPRVAAVLEGGYNLATLPRSSRRRYGGSRPASCEGWNRAAPGAVVRAWGGMKPATGSTGCRRRSAPRPTELVVCAAREQTAASVTRSGATAGRIELHRSTEWSEAERWD